VSFSFVGLIGVLTRNLEPNAEMGDSLNQYRLASTAAPGELPWSQTSAIITTPDAASAATIRDGLQAAGLPSGAINVQIVPSLLSDRLKFGTGISSSVSVTGFRFVGRTAMQRKPIMDPSNCIDAFDEQPRRTCFQGSQDISYGGADPVMADGGMYLVVGVIHARTDLARYASIGFIRDNIDTLELDGTANVWARGVGGPKSDQIYSRPSFYSLSRANSTIRVVSFIPFVSRSAPRQG